MNILELAERYTPLKQKSAHEWEGPCYACGGKDRFYVRTDSQTWACRGCAPDEPGIRRDDILFCRQMLGMSFQDACRATERYDKIKGPAMSQHMDLPKPKPIERPPAGPSPQWQEQAARVASWCHKQLMKRPDLLAWLERERGISRFTVEAWQLGFNPKHKQSDPVQWGEPAGSGPMKLFAGIVIPLRQPDGAISALKIRRFRPGDGAPADVTPKAEPDPRYVYVRGGSGRPWCLARGEAVTGPVIIVESELDALLLWQDLDLMATPIALLNATAKPATLPPGPVLCALDFDKAGQDAWLWWRDKQHQAKPAAPIEGKDISDMCRAGVRLLGWLKDILEREGLLRPDVLNPYAHLSLLPRERVPGHLWEQSAELMMNWQLVCDDPAARRRVEREYQALWGIERRAQA